MMMIGLGLSIVNVKDTSLSYHLLVDSVVIVAKFGKDDYTVRSSATAIGK
jgi:hypothetical protein